MMPYFNSKDLKRFIYIPPKEENVMNLWNIDIREPEPISEKDVQDNGKPPHNIDVCEAHVTIGFALTDFKLGKIDEEEVIDTIFSELRSLSFVDLGLVLSNEHVD